MIRLIVSDLDGTLLDEPNSISRINLDAIDYAYRKGARFGFATGRDLGNGAVIYDGEGTIVGEDFFPNPYLAEVTEILNRHGVRHMIFTTDGFYTTTDPAEVKQKFIERIAALVSREVAGIYDTDKDKPCNNLVRITDMDAFVREKKIIKVEGFHMDFAPENSCPEIKSKAYRIVKSCKEHGVSQAIYEFV